MAKRMKLFSAQPLYQSSRENKACLWALQTHMGHKSPSALQSYMLSLGSKTSSGAEESPLTPGRELRHLVAFFTWVELMTSLRRNGETLTIRFYSQSHSELHGAFLSGLLPQAHHLSKADALHAHLSSLDCQLGESR
ncbi:hypothetical protein [Burkholderia sp. THE68]|uniref:hypothetical protein n=1 Tax=Burkholderia sp. THE68 TaxID=758782 RepID=UPI0013899A70|nr:hypothetical protein [Burkholderia sp. THE68]